MKTLIHTVLLAAVMVLAGPALADHHMKGEGKKMADGDKMGRVMEERYKACDELQGEQASACREKVMADMKARWEERYARKKANCEAKGGEMAQACLQRLESRRAAHEACHAKGNPEAVHHCMHDLKKQYKKERKGMQEKPAARGMGY